MLHFFKLMILQKKICYFVFDGNTFWFLKWIWNYASFFRK
jgi:hypothetical protein